MLSVPRPSRVPSYTSIPPNAILCPQLPASCPVMLQKREPKRVSRRRKFLADRLHFLKSPRQHCWVSSGFFSSFTWVLRMLFLHLSGLYFRNGV